jgi:hypothetical protein
VAVLIATQCKSIIFKFCNIVQINFFSVPTIGLAWEPNFDTWSSEMAKKTSKQTSAVKMSRFNQNNTGLGQFQHYSRQFDFAFIF